MIERLPEFIANHAFLSAAFVVIAVLLIATETRRGGKSLAPSLVGGVVNRDQGVLVDVRSESDFRAGHIAGSINIPHTQFASRVADLQKYLGKPLVVVCNMGSSAGDVANQLVKAGHAPVYCLSGGITAWRGENLPVVRS